MEEKKERKNKKTKSVGNGEGSLYFSEKLDCYVFQYVHNGSRKTIRQKKNEGAKEFKDRVAELKVRLNNGTYIEKSIKSTKYIIEKHLKQKFNDGITSGRSYRRDLDTLKVIEKCCSDFICKPIQNVTLEDIEDSKEKMKKYAQNTIDKMWRLLRKAFAIASSPSVRLIIFNIMQDENLKKPISNKKTKKIYPLTKEERIKLEHVLDNEERNHKYRNVVKTEWITSMRISEALSRTIQDICDNFTSLHIHNTLTEDENNNIIIGEHTKTYNKITGIDEGERFFPISTELKQILEEQLSNEVMNIHGLLFWDYTKNTFMNDAKINSWLARINKKYKISDKVLHNHRLRHDRITQWKETGMDIEAIQYLAGHVEGSKITEDVYIDVSKDFAFKEYQKVAK